MSRAQVINSLLRLGSQSYRGYIPTSSQLPSSSPLLSSRSATPLCTNRHFSSSFFLQDKVNITFIQPGSFSLFIIIFGLKQSIESYVRRKQFILLPGSARWDIYFVFADGTEKEVAVNEGENVLEIAHAHHIDLEGACEGSLACSTCHIILPEGKWIYPFLILLNRSNCNTFFLPSCSSPLSPTPLLVIFII